MLGSRERRWARLLEALPGAIGRVEAWTDPRPAGSGDGHQHHVPTLVACLDGALRVEGPGRRVDLARGDLLAIAPGVWHRHERLRGAAVAWMQGFLHAGSDVNLADPAGGWWGTLPTEPSRPLIERILAAPRPETRRALAAELARAILASDLRPLGLAADPLASRMLHALWRGLHRGGTGGDVIRAAGCRRSRAYAVFTALYGLPPHRTVLAARLELAAALLRAGLPVATVAARCGFPDRRALTRAWRRRHGTPPRALRAAPERPPG